jgi:hypothetical protein
VACSCSRYLNARPGSRRMPDLPDDNAGIPREPDRRLNQQAQNVDSQDGGEGVIVWALEQLSGRDKFLGFDGSLPVDAPPVQRWHDLPLKIRQPLPPFLRRYPYSYNTYQRILFRIWRLGRS